MADAAKPVLKDGKVISDKIVQKIFATIEKGVLLKVDAIVVHQTGSSTAEGTFASYKTGRNGAHFLIDKNGTIYQTARVTQKCWHVGNIRSRCYSLHTCSVDELKTINGIMHNKADSYGAQVRKLNAHEMKKDYPERYPSNNDSIGVEMVANFVRGTFDKATDAQNTALRWLITTLEQLLGLADTDLYRHPEVSYKQPSEASSAKW